MKAMLAVGIGGFLGSIAPYKLGGMVVFSAFGFDTLYLLRRREPGWAFANLVLSMLAGVGAVWLGWKAVEFYSTR